MASAMVKLLQISTAVLVAPNLHLEQVAAGDERRKMQSAIDRVGREHPAEEKDFRGQEHPHAEPAGVVLLLANPRIDGRTR